MSAIEWQGIVVQSLGTMWEKFASFAPNLIAACTIMILGWMLAAVVRKVAITILQKLGFDRLTDKAGLIQIFKHVDLKITGSGILGCVIFWLILAMTLVSASESLGLERLTQSINMLIGYIPNVIAAVVVVVFGLWGANTAGSLVRGAATRTDLGRPETLGNITYVALATLTVVLALGQLQIETHLLNRVIEIGLLTVGIALALAFGLGSRDVARNLLSGIYAREEYTPGAKLFTDGYEGTLVQIGTIVSEIETAEGEIVRVPNSHLTNTAIKASGQK